MRVPIELLGIIPYLDYEIFYVRLPILIDPQGGRGLKIYDNLNNKIDGRFKIHRVREETPDYEVTEFEAEKMGFSSPEIFEDWYSDNVSKNWKIRYVYAVEYVTEESLSPDELLENYE